MRCLGTALVIWVLAAGSGLAQTTPEFASRKDFTGLATSDTIVADVNNDGNLDLVATHDGNVHILLGDGKGGFVATPNQRISAGILGKSAAIDINGDGNLDLVLAGNNGNYGGVLASLGNGDGTFTAGNFYLIQAVGFGVGGFGVGDFNGDGKIDIVAVGDTGLWFLAGNGDGSFQEPVNEAPLEYGATGATAADFNGDGKLDVAVPIGFGGVGFQVYFGNGDGTFQAPLAFSRPSNAFSLVTIQLTAGGPLSLVVGSRGSSDVWIYPNDGLGHFSSPHYANLPGADSIAVGDMDGDGNADLVSSLGYVAYGATGGTFPTTDKYPILAPLASNYTVALGDLTNNGKLDIVTNSYYAISVVFNEGKRTFLEGNWTPVTGGGLCGASGDFNGDGRPDLAINNGTGIQILLASGSVAHPLNVGALLPLASAGCPAVGDVNGDGILDLVVPSSSGAVTFLGNGDGTFTQKSTTVASANGVLVLGDFNRDGKLDFATSGNLLAYGNGDGTFQTPKAFVFNPPNGGFAWIAVGDLNNDGWPDLALTSSITDDFGFNVYSMLNNQEGGFTYVNAGYGAERTQILLADLNGDGFLDMVVEPIAGSGAGIFFGKGNGQFTAGPDLGGPGADAGANVIGDFNGDGILDVGLLGDNGILIYPGLGSGTFGTAVGYGAGNSPAFVLPIHLLRPTRHAFPDLAFPDPSGGVTVIYNLTK